MDKKINMLDLHSICPYISHLSLTFLVAKLKKKKKHHQFYHPKGRKLLAYSGKWEVELPIGGSDNSGDASWF